MFTAAAIIAKVVDFIVAKTVGKLVALPFDKHKKACRSLTKLYYCLQTLDDVTALALQTIEDFRDRGTAEALLHALRNHSRDIELASNMFIDLSQELERGLEIIDPVLARCCYLIYEGKMDFLMFMSTNVEQGWTGSAPTAVLKRPRGRLNVVDMDAMYKLTAEAMAAGDNCYWPPSPFSDFSADFEDVRIEFEDEAAAAGLLEMILHQNARLKQAKERLRILIKDNFSIEEVLFQSDSHPYR